MPVKVKERFESFHSRNMLKEEKAKKELEERRRFKYIELYHTCGTLSVHALECLCRQIHTIEIKIHSLRGGLNDKE